MKPNWELKNCCNHEQVVFLVTVAVCTVLILALWRTLLLTPFKLVTVFLHEASHAVACKLTCGHVEGIQVHADEGGTTQTRGGIYCFILPAGLDSPRTLHWPRSGFIIFLGIIWILQETTKVRILRYVILFIGVMNSLFSVYDIYDDLISRRVHSSDAEKFAQECPCPCSGVGWGVICISFQGFDIICVSMRSCVPGCCHLVLTQTQSHFHQTQNQKFHL
ncbi:uncharacterized protein LOC107478787 isoform X3 [Arachis duranensis]|uniref:Uncharacterized protein LOC107478787 isoform X3 n=1 Tax=Arachis duranensis TaxID=130453 RepID=A0A9C6WSC2_ARADU|nr:uncharacterized protein LOC107478787 isoform X3 [Arachis duranensis]